MEEQDDGVEADDHGGQDGEENWLATDPADDEQPVASEKTPDECPPEFVVGEDLKRILPDTTLLCRDGHVELHSCLLARHCYVMQRVLHEQVEPPYILDLRGEGFSTAEAVALEELICLETIPASKVGPRFVDLLKYLQFKNVYCYPSEKEKEVEVKLEVVREQKEVDKEKEMMEPTEQESEKEKEKEIMEPEEHEGEKETEAVQKEKEGEMEDDTPIIVKEVIAPQFNRESVIRWSGRPCEKESTLEPVLMETREIIEQLTSDAFLTSEKEPTTKLPTTTEIEVTMDQNSVHPASKNKESYPQDCTPEKVPFHKSVSLVPKKVQKDPILDPDSVVHHSENPKQKENGSMSVDNKLEMVKIDEDSMKNLLSLSPKALAGMEIFIDPNKDLVSTSPKIIIDSKKDSVPASSKIIAKNDSVSAPPKNPKREQEISQFLKRPVNKHQTPPDIKKYMCELCGIMFKYETDLHVHKKLDHKEDENIFKCPSCLVKFQDIKSFDLHLKQDHSKTDENTEGNIDEKNKMEKKEEDENGCIITGDIGLKPEDVTATVAKNETTPKKECCNNKNVQTSGDCENLSHPKDDEQPPILKVGVDLMNASPLPPFLTPPPATEERVRVEFVHMDHDYSALNKMQSNMEIGDKQEKEKKNQCKWLCMKCRKKFDTKKEGKTHCKIAHPKGSVVLVKVLPVPHLSLPHGIKIAQPKVSKVTVDPQLLLPLGKIAHPKGSKATPDPQLTLPLCKMAHPKVSKVSPDPQLLLPLGKITYPKVSKVSPDLVKITPDPELSPRSTKKPRSRGGYENVSHRKNDAEPPPTLKVGVDLISSEDSPPLLTPPSAREQGVRRDELSHTETNHASVEEQIQQIQDGQNKTKKKKKRWSIYDCKKCDIVFETYEEESAHLQKFHRKVSADPIPDLRDTPDPELSPPSAKKPRSSRSPSPCSRGSVDPPRNPSPCSNGRVDLPDNVPPPSSSPLTPYNAPSPSPCSSGSVDLPTNAEQSPNLPSLKPSTVLSPSPRSSGSADPPTNKEPNPSSLMPSTTTTSLPKIYGPFNYFQVQGPLFLSPFNNVPIPMAGSPMDPRPESMDNPTDAPNNPPPSPTPCEKSPPYHPESSSMNLSSETVNSSSENEVAPLVNPPFSIPHAQPSRLWCQSESVNSPTDEEGSSKTSTSPPNTATPQNTPTLPQNILPQTVYPLHKSHPADSSPCLPLDTLRRSARLKYQCEQCLHCCSSNTALQTHYSNAHEETTDCSQQEELQPHSDYTEPQAAVGQMPPDCPSTKKRKTHTYSCTWCSYAQNLPKGEMIQHLAFECDVLATKLEERCRTRGDGPFFECGICEGVRIKTMGEYKSHMGTHLPQPDL